MAFTSGQWGPDTFIDSAGNTVLIGATVVATGYVCTVDALGNLTVTGPAADAVELTVTPATGAAYTETIRVLPLAAEIEDKDTAAQAAAEAAAAVLADAAEAAAVASAAADATAKAAAAQAAAEATAAAALTASEASATATYAALDADADLAIDDVKVAETALPTRLGTHEGYGRRFIPAPQFSSLSGSPVAAVVNEWPVWTFADATTQHISAAVDLPPDWDDEFIVHVLWINASAAAGNFRLGYALAQQTEGDTIAGGTTQYLTLTAGAQNVVTRTQLGGKVTLKDFNYSRIRLSRYGTVGEDTLAGSVYILGVEVTPSRNIPARVTEATVTDATGHTVTRHATPYDGVKAETSTSIFTPLWSTATAVFVAEPVTIGGTQQSRAARLSKAYATEQDVQLLAATHDVLYGHRNPSIAVDPNGTVVAYPETHATAFAGKHSTAANDLTTLTATAAPSGAATSFSYRRFFRNPLNGEVWMGARGDGYYGRIYKWNNTAKTWDFKGANPFTFTDIAYGMEMAFSATGTIYVATEWQDGSPGYPRRDLGVVMSTDDGATWQTVAGSRLSLPVTSSNQQTVFPSKGTTHNGVAVCIAADGSGNPLLVAAYQHPTETYRSLWQARYNTTTKRFDLSRLIKGESHHIGLPRIAYLPSAGRIVVTVSEYDDHDLSNTETRSATPAGPLWALVTDDGGATWDRYELDDGTTATYSGAYLDPESARIDGVWRVLPTCLSTPTKSEIWEVTLPA